MRPAYITATRWQIDAATPRSWVIRMMPTPVSRCSSRNSSIICTWMVTSRLLVGSSAISTFGVQAIAIAATTRWRMPPLNWCG